jgi:hypothetical protein
LSFIVSYLRGEIDGQDPDKDIFNRRGQENPALIPSAFRESRLDKYVKEVETIVKRGRNAK